MLVEMHRESERPARLQLVADCVCVVCVCVCRRSCDRRKPSLKARSGTCAWPRLRANSPAAVASFSKSLSLGNNGDTLERPHEIKESVVCVCMCVQKCIDRNSV